MARAPLEKLFGFLPHNRFPGIVVDRLIQAFMAWILFFRCFMVLTLGAPMFKVTNMQHLFHNLQRKILLALEIDLALVV